MTKKRSVFVKMCKKIQCCGVIPRKSWQTSVFHIGVPLVRRTLFSTTFIASSSANEKKYHSRVCGACVSNVLTYYVDTKRKNRAILLEIKSSRLYFLSVFQFLTWKLFFAEKAERNGERDPQETTEAKGLYFCSLSVASRRFRSWSIFFSSVWSRRVLPHA